ncbi:MAG: ABC transporter substrate-binding protein, partial [Desulfitobacteriaceae bacterium]
IDLLIDRDAIVKVVLANAGTAAHSPFPKSNLAYGDSDKYDQPNLEKAKALLAKAGKPNGFSFTLKLDMDPVNQQVGQMIQNMLKPAGIEVTLEKVEFGALLDQSEKGNYEAATISWSGRMDPDQNIYDWFVTGGTENYSRYVNPEVDKLLNAARAEQDNGKRKDIYDKVLTIIHRDVPYVYFYHEHNVYGLSKSVQGFTYIPDGMIRTANLSLNK